MLEITADELPRFMACNASKFMPPAFPETLDENKVRDEGIAAHYMALQVWRGVNAPSELINQKAPNGIFMTAEMADHVEDFIAAINRGVGHTGEFETITTFTDNTTYRVAARADHIGISDDGITLYVDDFKYGYRIVDPEWHWSLIAHAIGWCFNQQIEPASVVLTIHQPRPFHPDGPRREWRMTFDQLIIARDLLVEALRSPSDELRTSNHCGRCHALANCRAASNASMNAIDIIEEMHVDNITDDRLAFELDTLNRASAMLKSRLEALEELASHRIDSGAVINNYAREQALGNRVWNDGLTADTLQLLTGKRLTVEKLITPAQAEKLDVPKIVVNGLSKRPSIGIRLKRVNTDKRAKRLLGK